MKKLNKSKWIICSCLVLQLICATNVYADTNYPNKYDMREYNQVTSIKDQGKTMNCWAYAAVSSLESSLKKDTGATLDFSETHIIEESQGFDIDTENQGGTVDMAIAYFANNYGPVMEDSQVTSSYYVGEIKKISPGTGSYDNDNIKKAIMEDGAVYSAMKYDDAFFNKETNSYFSDSLSVGQNHAITIVGWDDNYSKEHFGTVKPYGDGAFICKNQYGKSFGEQGYFYVSYFDLTLSKKENAVFKAVKDLQFNKLYSYDPLGNTEFIESIDIGQTFANTFNTKDKEELLSGVSFYTNIEKVPYKIFLVNGRVDYNTPLPTTPLVTGTTSYAGYHTVKVPAQLLDSNSSFTIVVTFDDPEAEIPVESRMPNYSSKAFSKPGQSYIEKNGHFEDLTGLTGHENSNVCIKAFTYNPYVETEAFLITDVKWDNIKIGESAKISLTIENKSENDETYSLGLCLYEEIDDTYKMIRSGFIDEILQGGESRKLSLSTLVPDKNSNYKLKAFLWKESDGHSVILDTPFVTNIQQEAN